MDPLQRVGWVFWGAWAMSANTHFPYPSYARPPCSKCGATMMLSRVDREDWNYSKRTFDCVPCDRHETVTVQHR